MELDRLARISSIFTIIFVTFGLLIIPSNQHAQEISTTTITEKEIEGSLFVEKEQTRNKTIKTNRPIWKSLESMSQAEKENAEIELILGGASTEEAEQLASRIQDLWNSYQFDEALSLFPELAQLTNINEIAVGTAWRIPIPTENPDQWGNDVRIGNRDSVWVTVLDIHRESGNLFTILGCDFDDISSEGWCVYHSTDGGESWMETYRELERDVKSLSASVVGEHCYVAWYKGAEKNIKIRRYKESDGSQDQFTGGDLIVSVFVSPEEIEEVKLISNQDYENDRLYLFAITSEGNLRHFTDDPEAISWDEITTDITNADRGLDATRRAQVILDYYLYISYIDRNNCPQIAGYKLPSGWDDLCWFGQVGDDANVTAIGAYDNYITMVFEDRYDPTDECKYIWSNDNGDNWNWSSIDDPIATSLYCPNITLRDSGGAAIVYQAVNPVDPFVYAGRFKWRDYSGSWTDPVRYSDLFYHLTIQPSIEYLGDNSYGVVYIGDHVGQSLRQAYFDRSDWIADGIGDSPATGPELPKSFSLAQNYPNPFNPSTVISYELVENAHVTLKIHNIRGQMIKELVSGLKEAGAYSVQWDGRDALGQRVPSGIYFYVLNSNKGFRSTKKMVVLK
jgi:hypothetical protein